MFLTLLRVLPRTGSSSIKKVFAHVLAIVCTFPSWPMRPGIHTA